MQCVPDLIKPIEARGSLSVTFNSFTRKLKTALDYTPETQVSSRSAGAPPGWNLTFREESTYFVKGSVLTAESSAPRQKVTVWISDKVPASTVATARTIDAFRCELGRIDLSKYTPVAVAGGGYRVDFNEEFVVPKNCNESLLAMKAMVQTAWAVNGISSDGGIPFVNAADVGTTFAFFKNGLASRIMASYDLEGGAIVQAPATTAANTCVVKPVEFFFNYKTPLEGVERVRRHSHAK